MRAGIQVYKVIKVKGENLRISVRVTLVFNHGNRP